jgi:hypothetical protein
MIMKKQLLCVSILFSLLLISCGKSPESTGKNIAEKMCNCKEKDEELEYESSLKIDEQLLSELKDKKFQNRQDFDTRRRELMLAEENGDKGKNMKDCEAEVNEMKKEALLKFAKEDDRKTMANAAEALYSSCTDERKNDRKERREKLEQIRTEVNNRSSQLPYAYN